MYDKGRMPTAQQFICKKCKALSNVDTFEKTANGIYYCRCPNCAAKNKVVQTGATPSQPGILQVIGLLE
jgi:Zn finger protein HypA/HybF involved in hydrogenase expression